MFEEIFVKFHEWNKEIKIIGVWGKDGLGLEEKRFGESDLDLELIGAEIADIITKVDLTRTQPQAYALTLDVDSNRLHVFKLTEDFFLIILASPEAFPGRLNFCFNIYKKELLSQL